MRKCGILKIVCRFLPVLSGFSRPPAPSAPERSRKDKICCRINVLSVEKFADFKGFMDIWKIFAATKSLFCFAAL